MEQHEHIKGLYNPEDAKGSCRFGLIAHQKCGAGRGGASAAVTELRRMTQRGAVAGDGKTGDGCGVLLQFPESFFRQLAEEEGMWLAQRFAVGMIFLNPDPEIAARSRKTLNKHIKKETLDIAGWRTVPTNPSV